MTRGFVGFWKVRAMYVLALPMEVLKRDANLNQENSLLGHIQ